MARRRLQHPDYVTCKHCRRDFRAITVRHLRNIHGYEGDHPVQAYKRRFRLSVASCREVRKKIRDAKDDFWAKRGQHWTPAKLLAEVRAHHRAGGSLHSKKIPVRLYEASRRLFGSWPVAVQKAGLTYEGPAVGVKRWTPERVVEAIHELAKRGVPLTATYAKSHHSALFRAATRWFPFAWTKALQAAGLNPRDHRVSRCRWNRRDAESWVRKRIAQGKSILAAAAPDNLVEFVYRRLATGWTDFVESLGIPYPGIKKRRDWTKEKFLDEIRRWSAEGHRLNYRAVASEYQALIHQARKYFGSWDRALAAAGMPLALTFPP